MRPKSDIDAFRRVVRARRMASIGEHHADCGYPDYMCKCRALMSDAIRQRDELPARVAKVIGDRVTAHEGDDWLRDYKGLRDE